MNDRNHDSTYYDFHASFHRNYPPSLSNVFTFEKLSLKYNNYHISSFIISYYLFPCMESKVIFHNRKRIFDPWPRFLE